jgi:hypothetical protein
VGHGQVILNRFIAVEPSEYMKLYFSYSQMPELAGFTPLQRKLIYQCALEAFYHEQPSRVLSGAPWIFGGLLSGALAGGIAVGVSSLTPSKLLVIAGCALVGTLLGIFIGTQFLTEQLRPYCRRVLEERKDEIAQITSATSGKGEG